MKFRFLKFLCFILLFQFIAEKQAKAVSFGDAALTVSIATVSGAVLGVSTLPFYEDSGAHSKNIFYGAAIGAVVGVLISAYAGVEEGKNADEAEEDAFLKKKLEGNHLFAFQRSLKPESRIQNRMSAVPVASAVWTPIAQVSF